MDHRKMGYIYDVQLNQNNDEGDDKWYDNLMETPWFEIWIAFSALIFVCIVGCVLKRCLRRRSVDSYQNLTNK